MENPLKDEDALSSLGKISVSILATRWKLIINLTKRLTKQSHWNRKVTSYDDPSSSRYQTSGDLEFNE